MAPNSPVRVVGVLWQGVSYVEEANKKKHLIGIRKLYFDWHLP